MSRQLAVLLGLVAVTVAIVSLRTFEPVDGGVRLAELLPDAHDGWNSVGRASSEILPADPRALETIWQTYARNGDVVVVSVARYPSRNHPDHRPLHNFIVGAPATSQLHSTAVPLDTTGAVSAPLVLVERRKRPFAVTYWYQVNGEPISGEYALRYRVFLDTLRGQPQPLLLIRLAASDRPQLSVFLRDFYPRLRTLLVS